MKKQAIFIPILFIGLSSLSFGQILRPDYVVSEDEVFIEFNTAYTLEDLLTLKKELKSLDIDINYSLLEFSDSGQLSKITASIDYNDGLRGSFESRKLQAKGKPGPGFRRDFSKNPRRN